MYFFQKCIKLILTKYFGDNSHLFTVTYNTNTCMHLTISLRISLHNEFFNLVASTSDKKVINDSKVHLSHSRHIKEVNMLPQTMTQQLQPTPHHSFYFSSTFLHSTEEPEDKILISSTQDIVNDTNLYDISLDALS